jgi:hypothetical protein
MHSWIRYALFIDFRMCVNTGVPRGKKGDLSKDKNMLIFLNLFLIVLNGIILCCFRMIWLSM